VIRVIEQFYYIKRAIDLFWERGGKGDRDRYLLVSFGWNGDRINQPFQYTSSLLPMSSKRISSSPNSGFLTKSNTIRQSYSTVQAQEPAN
jgi:hypothetical protein